MAMPCCSVSSTNRSLPSGRGHHSIYTGDRHIAEDATACYMTSVIVQYCPMFNNNEHVDFMNTSPGYA